MQTVNINEIHGNPDNPRIIRDDKFKKLVKSLQSFPEMMELRPVVVNKEMMILGGNMRYEAAKAAGWKEIPVTIADLTPDQQREFIIKDNVSGGEWDFDALANGWDIELLKDWGLDIPAFDESKEDREAEAHNKLTDKFIIQPFSVLDTRQGYWQERKKHWVDLIGDSGESRKGLLMGDDSLKKLVNNTFLDVSILDPVLSELANLWFGLPNGKTFDCFAGDSVFGYVSTYLGNNFTGIELRQEQVDLNNQRLKGRNSIYHCDDGQNVLKYVPENSQDLLFSCPPYFDLEVYSDLANDASNQKEYKDFLKILDNAFTDSLKCLKQNRFAVIIVGDVRDKKGFYRRFVDDVKDIFKNNGVQLYNELILVNFVGSLCVRAEKLFTSRKIGKVHQNVLVFFKGDPKEIKNIYPKLEIQVDGSEDV